MNQTRPPERNADSLLPLYTLRMRLLIATLLSLTAFSAFAEINPNSPQAWIDSPEAYFVSPDERVEWGTKVRSDESAREFIAEYWHRHGEALHQEIDRRVAFADKTFPLAKTPGSRTEQGRVWMILGSPTTAKNIHTSINGDISGSSAGRLQNNILKQQAKMTVIWTYNGDRLPKDLHLPRLEVRFVQDVSRGYQMIDNPDQVEPVLVRAVALFNEGNPLPLSGKPANAAGTESRTTTTTITSTTTQAAPENPYWSSPDDLGGTFFTGEPYVSPTGKPFYAVDFYVPARVLATDDLIIEGELKDASGHVAATVNASQTAKPYGNGNDRYADASVEVPPGTYKAVFALKTKEGRNVGVTHTTVNIPPSDWSGLSRPLMTNQVTTLDKQGPLDPFTFIATKYAVKGDRKFHATEPVGFFAILTSPTEPDLQLKMKMNRDGHPAGTAPFAPIPLVQTGPHTYLVGTQFEPKTFSPGHYELDIEVRDGRTKKTYSTAGDFDVIE